MVAMNHGRTGLHVADLASAARAHRSTAFAAPPADPRQRGGGCQGSLRSVVDRSINLLRLQGGATAGAASELLAAPPAGARVVREDAGEGGARPNDDAVRAMVVQGRRLITRIKSKQVGRLCPLITFSQEASQSFMSKGSLYCGRGALLMRDAESLSGEKDESRTDPAAPDQSSNQPIGC